ncbi:MFS transporter [Corynebacterium breve]|uniref:MFS transporter n=1 Tax=Corynebacterium breve TaxID=3049799 RepID=A0ABY8VIS8_9CORY|nr:MFS transporter [Corynebacterium breve]WIM68665.1 MFS transporter [Corynebacterium breve]
MKSSQETKKSSRWFSLCALSAGYFLIMLDQAVMPVLTPRLPAAVDDQVWITSIYLLCTVVPMLVTGRLGDKRGQRRIYLVGLVAYIAGLLVCALSSSFIALVVGRAIQGLGAAAFLPQAFSIIGRVFPSDARGPAFALWGVVGSIGSLVGPLFAGVLLNEFGWRSAFAAQVALGTVALILAVLWLPRLSTTSAVIDAPSVLISLAGLGLLMWGIQYAQAWAIVVGLVALILFAWLQTRSGDEALLPLGLFRNRNFTLGSIGIAAMGFVVACQFIPIMYWLQDIRGLDAVTAGLLTIPMSIVALVLTPFVGVAADRIDPKVLSVVGFGTLFVSMVWSWALMLGEGSALWMIGITALKGVGSAFIWAPNAATTMRTIPESASGAASGAYNTVRQVGSVIGVALIGGALGTWTPALGLQAATAWTMLILAAVMLVGLVASLFLVSDIEQ